MALNNSSRTTDRLPAIPDPVLQALADADAPFDLAAAVPEPQDAPVLRWGILGAGGIASTFATDVPAFSSGRIVAVGSRDRARAQAFIDAHPDAGKGQPVRAHGSYEALVGDPEVDAVYVATPHNFHCEQALLALEAGKPVLVEKSFARNAAEARRVFDAARATGLFVMEAMWTRFLPGQVLLRALAGSGALGELRYVRAEHLQSLEHVERLNRPELAGGALLDLGVYSVSFVHSLLGAPTSLSAAGRLSADGVDLDEAVSMTYPRALAVATSSMSAASETGGEVVGTRGRVVLPTQFYRPTRLEIVLGGSRGAPRFEWDATVPGGFQFQAAEVARCIAAGRTESGTMPWSETLAVLETMDEARRQLGVTYPGE
ncbi:MULTISPECIES: Gfo/Idh/MocA family oxidoreductase [unclassified Actinomyces]|uniref:Gfo/Idh/MocA family protein n=1 Tax=unclassified Actinomyces TaxID=2609248 RepID=UPI0013A6F26E|nr:MULTISPECIES: Gfo/Idh/MocA family oxidoreductase [unclassified Actinomyces]MBW3069285.1 Gfo/Idh/MocA family oxidoreductase [Actinomyces sp. 594]NDR52846.1 Gfo/Idh/MocA family oxidoreductase [Actinomyces sp. 565]